MQVAKGTQTSFIFWYLRVGTDTSCTASSPTVDYCELFFCLLKGIPGQHPVRGHPTGVQAVGLHGAQTPPSPRGLSASLLRRAATGGHHPARQEPPPSPLQLQCRWSVRSLASLPLSLVFNIEVHRPGLFGHNAYSYTV